MQHVSFYDVMRSHAFCYGERSSMLLFGAALSRRRARRRRGRRRRRRREKVPSNTVDVAATDDERSKHAH